MRLSIIPAVDTDICVPRLGVDITGSGGVSLSIMLSDVCSAAQLWLTAEVLWDLKMQMGKMEQVCPLAI